MRGPSFQRRFSAVLALTALILGMGQFMGNPLSGGSGSAISIGVSAQDRVGSVGVPSGNSIAGPHSIEFAGGSIAAINLPNIGVPWHLSKVQLVGGAGVGSYAYLFDGASKAHFVVTNAGFAEWDLDFTVPGTSIPITSQTTTGTAPSRVNLIFSPIASPGALPITAYRAIFITAAPGGANATPVAIAAVNYDIAPAVPTGILAFISAGNAQIIFQATGGPQEIVEAMLATITFIPTITFAPALPQSQSANLSETNSAAATLIVYLFYKPFVAGVAG
jgi:hypothetical protein